MIVLNICDKEINYGNKKCRTAGNRGHAQENGRSLRKTFGGFPGDNDRRRGHGALTLFVLSSGITFLADHIFDVSILSKRRRSQRAEQQRMDRPQMGDRVARTGPS